MSLQGQSIKPVIVRLVLINSWQAGGGGVVQAPGPQESNVVMDMRWCPTDPIAESPTVLQSNLQQSMTDGEGGRAAKASAERRGPSGFGMFPDQRTKIRHLGILWVCRRGASLQESSRDSGLGIRRCCLGTGFRNLLRSLETSGYPLNRARG
jgi:hypothetical protein